MTYNITALQHSASIFTLVTQGNTFTNGLLIGLFTLAIFIVSIMKLKTYDFSKALLASSVMAFVISLFFVYAKMLNPIWALGYLVIAALTVLAGTLFGG